MNNMRVRIAHIFTDILRHGKTLEEALARHRATEEAFIKAHIYGLCRWYFQLEAVAQKLLTRPLKAKDSDIYALLLLGLHQIFYSHLQPHALVSEIVAAAAALNKSWAKGVMNACLRRALREREALWHSMSDATQLSVAYAHPGWMVAQLKAAWPQDWQQILTANNVQAPMTLRVNLSRADAPPTLMHWLATSCRAHAEVPGCFSLLLPQSVHTIPGFAEGMISVQDQASQIAVRLLPLQPQDRVLDACAAPGGKTGYLLELEPRLQVIALDCDAHRLKKVTENLERLRLTERVRCKAADAADLSAWFDGRLFDKILIDAPCSGTGVIRRHPDIKLLRRAQDIKKFSEQQQKLLQALWPTLKVGGCLLYTTCSILPEENEQVIAAFLKTQRDAYVKTLTLPNGQRQPHGWQCFPQAEGQDGFYYCLLEKKC